MLRKMYVSLFIVFFISLFCMIGQQGLAFEAVEPNTQLILDTPATFAIVDKDHQIYTYPSLEEYLFARGEFQQKWSKQMNPSGKATSEFFEDPHFGGWQLTLSVGSIANLESTQYGQAISSLATAERGSGTEVCMKNICQTYAPGLKISYVGKEWDNKITSLGVMD